MSFVKLDCDITKSTMWSYDPATKVVWITLLAEATWEGIVIGTIPGIARVANVSVEEARRAFEIFLAPDPESTSPENEGRRIERIERGWRVLNHEKYRELGADEKKREADRVRIAEKRANTRATVANVANSRATVAYTDTDRDPEKDLKQNRIGENLASGNGDLDPEEVKAIAKHVFKVWPRPVPSREREEPAVAAFVKGIRSKGDLVIFRVTFEEYERVLGTWPEESLHKAFNMATFFTSKYANYFPDWFDASCPEESYAAHQAASAAPATTASPTRFSTIED